MPDILSIKTQDWELSVWSQDISKRASMLANTLSDREVSFTESLVSLSGAVEIEEVVIKDNGPVSFSSSDNKISLKEPLFFENLSYEFEFVFSKNVNSNNTKSPQVRHKLLAINEVFHYVNRRGLASLRGAVNFRNDIGWFRLPIRYWLGDKQKDVSLSFEVLPTKMDLANDLKAIHLAIDEHYPLWRFALAERTEQDSGTSNKRSDPFPLFWISLFKDLQAELNKGITLILNSPHSRLLPNSRSIRAERLKGKLPNRLAEQVKQDVQSGNLNKRYSVDLKKLSVDTPENRFIKMVIKESRTKLSHFSKIAEDADSSRTQGRLSDAFFSQIADWKKPLARYLSHPLFAEVGAFRAMSRESLVLQQKPGYSKVYKVWQQLKLYLDVMGNQTSISMKSVAELYEVWCFLEVRRILIDELGFYEKGKSSAKLENKGHELITKDGFNGSFELCREDGIEVSLVHEPIFGKHTKKVARSWITTQKPDILLRAKFASGDWLIWLFDAKYRIKQAGELDDFDSFDKVPDDAINQMHRYRDALIHQHKESERNTKSRPVFGAFALYPGFFDQTKSGAKNHYAEAISEVGIGAFPLLPSSAGSNGSYWLKEFLREKLGKKESVYSSPALPDKHYVEESVRIPYTGFEQTRYSDLTMIISLAPSNGREYEYTQSFVEGIAKWYHVPERTIRKGFANTIIHELRYLAVIIPIGLNEKAIKWVWTVESAKLEKRKDLKSEWTGKSTESNDLYWLLELGSSFQLETEISGFSGMGFMESMKLTTLNELNNNRVFQEIPKAYEGFFGANV